jgi:hypothetical protein
LTSWRRRGLVPGVIAWRPVLRLGAPLLGVLSVSGAVQWEARAAGESVADRARSLLTHVEADASVRQLVSPATSRAGDALRRAEAASVGAPAHAQLLESIALEWAQVAHDLKRARDAELASDRLEQEVSSVQTELVRSRAAVEQTMARVGRAREELAELEAVGASKARAGSAPRGKALPGSAAPGRVAPGAAAPEAAPPSQGAR